MKNDIQIDGNPARMFKGKRPLFSKRFCQSDPHQPIAQLAAMLATVIAEDANTAFYVIEYAQKGNENARQDYIHYLANRIEYEMKKVGIK